MSGGSVERRDRRRAQDRDNKAGSERHLEFLRSMIRNYTKQVRAGEIGDSETLAHLATLRRELDEQTALCVLEMKSQGVSWQEIAVGLGMNRTAAYNKYVGRMSSFDDTGSTLAAETMAGAE